MKLGTNEIFQIAVQIWNQRFKIQNSEQNFEKLLNMMDLYEVRYCKIFYDFYILYSTRSLELLNRNFIQKYKSTRFLKFQSPYCIFRFELCYFDHKFICSRTKNSSIVIFIEMHQFINVIEILCHCIEPAISNFAILTSNSNTST